MKLSEVCVGRGVVRGRYTMEREEKERGKRRRERKS